MSLNGFHGPVLRPRIENGIPRWKKAAAGDYGKVCLVGSGAGEFMRVYAVRKPPLVLVAVLDGLSRLLPEDVTKAKRGAWKVWSSGFPEENAWDFMSDRFGVSFRERRGVYVTDHCDGETGFGLCPVCGQEIYYKDFSTGKTICRSHCPLGGNND